MPFDRLVVLFFGLLRRRIHIYLELITVHLQAELFWNIFQYDRFPLRRARMLFQQLCLLVRGHEQHNVGAVNAFCLNCCRYYERACNRAQRQRLRFLRKSDLLEKVSVRGVALMFDKVREFLLESHFLNNLFAEPVCALQALVVKVIRARYVGGVY